MTTLRPAHETDLRSMYEVFYQNEISGTLHPPAPGPLPPYLRHVLQSGTMFVVEQDGKVIAFAGAIRRGTITFLTDLFVRPTHQSTHLGKTLLYAVLPQDGSVHCTMSSPDPRALALYIQAGMRPQWPLFDLSLETPPDSMPLVPDVEIIQADPHDPDLVAPDAQICGRLRPVDHLFWRRSQSALPIWF